MKSAKQLRNENPQLANRMAELFIKSSPNRITAIEVIETPNAKPLLHCVVVDSAIGNSEFVPIKTLNEASAFYRNFLDENGFGARDGGICYIYHGNKVVPRVSYNGRVWDGENYQPNATPIFDPAAQN